MRYPLQSWFAGRVVRLEATYGFVSQDGIGDWVFVSREIADRFHHEGPGATNLSPEALPN